MTTICLLTASIPIHTTIQQKTVVYDYCAMKVPFYTRLEDECTETIKTKDTLTSSISKNVTKPMRNHHRMSLEEEIKVCAILVTWSPILDNGQTIGQTTYGRRDVCGRGVRFEPTLHRFLLIHWFVRRSEASALWRLTRITEAIGAEFKRNRLVAPG